SRVIARLSGSPVPIATSLTLVAVAVVPLPEIDSWETVSTGLEVSAFPLATQSVFPSGDTTTPEAPSPVGIGAPIACVATSIGDTVPPPGLVTQAVEPSGLNAIWLSPPDPPTAIAGCGRGGVSATLTGTAESCPPA